MGGRIMLTMKKDTIMKLFGFTILALLFFVPSFASAQGMYGGGGMGGMYGGGMGGMYGGMYGGMGMTGGTQGPGRVVVKYGEKVYDAVFGDLIDYKVYYIPMGADQIGVHYHDDGTHGDEVAYDGMPSLITINRDTYLGPFSIKYKRQLKKALEHAEKMGALKFYNLNVATDMPESSVTDLNDWQTRLGGVLDDLRAIITQFEGYDDQTYIKSIDPQIFESQEGFGGMSQAALGPGGYLPDLPPPPGLQQPRQEGAELDQGQMQGQPGQQQQEPQRFNPIERAQGAASAASGMTGNQLQATEAMNQLP